MRILILNQYFAPDVAASAQRLTELAEDLAARHDVTVVTGRPSYEHSTDGPMPSPTHRGSLRVVRVPSTAFARYRGWQRVLNYLSFLAGAAVAALWRHRPDLVIAGTDPPVVGLVGLIVGRLRRAPFVLLLWDIHPQVALVAGLLRSSVLTAALARLNRGVLRRADGVIVPTADMARTALREGVCREHLEVIPHWEDTDVIIPQGKDNPFSRSCGLMDKFVVMYSGNWGLTQQLDRYLDLGTRLADLPEIVLVFIGAGAEGERLETRARAQAGDRIRFLPYQPRARMIHSLATADVFLVPLGSGLTAYMLPSKIYTIMASGRPMIGALDVSCEVARLLQDIGCGLVSPPADLDGVEEHIRFLYHHPSERQEMGQRARAAVEARFARPIVTERYIAWFERYAPPGGG